MTLDPAASLLAHIDIEPRLLASLIVLGLCLVIWFFKAVFSGPEKGAVTRAGAPNCPTCGQQAKWLMPQNYWNCVRCNVQVHPPMPGQQPMGGAPNPYGQPAPDPYGQPAPNPYGQPAPNPYAQPPMGGAAPNPYAQPAGGPAPNPYAQPPVGGAPNPYAQPPTPSCGTCGGPGRWIPESNAWGCDRCRQLIQPR